MCSHCFPYIFPIYFPICSLYFLCFSNFRRRVPPAPGSLPWWAAPRASAASALWALRPVKGPGDLAVFYPAISPGFMRTIWGFVSKKLPDLLIVTAKMAVCLQHLGLTCFFGKTLIFAHEFNLGI